MRALKGRKMSCMKTYCTVFCLFSCCFPDVDNNKIAVYSHYSYLLTQNPFTIQGFAEQKNTLLSP